MNLYELYRILKVFLSKGVALYAGDVYDNGYHLDSFKFKILDGRNI